MRRFEEEGNGAILPAGTRKSSRIVPRGPRAEPASDRQIVRRPHPYQATLRLKTWYL